MAKRNLFRNLAGNVLGNKQMGDLCLQSSARKGERPFRGPRTVGQQAMPPWPCAAFDGHDCEETATVIRLEQRAANYGPRAKPHLPPVFVNEDLRTLPVTYILAKVHATGTQLSSCNRDHLVHGAYSVSCLSL